MMWLSRGCVCWLCDYSWSCIFYKKALEEFNLFTLKKRKKNHHPVNSDWTGWCLTVTEALEITKLLFAVGLPCPFNGIRGAI